ncbi:PTS sugar transporter subunit IIA [Boudabousia tangfeifanii]|uniref:PTS sugar transporter subunit IIA n=1 Tax=Boudabousia tangfeifanii TaxID=1912795 RepID=A0A1D9MM26_9ACTO|nr:PTS transporter subunit EIIC [Boudabousia tangfeifanii]AOZ73335.1 PTS sugar transporter subunit IIA [Boudabousia tangfeifanii]
MAKQDSKAFALAQRLGRSLMLPIATLPAAGLLLRIGQPDVLGADGLSKYMPFLDPVAQVMAAAGGAVFGNLPMLFAVGVAVGFAKKSDGSTGVAAVFGYLVFQAMEKVMSGYVFDMKKNIDVTDDIKALCEGDSVKEGVAGLCGLMKDVPATEVNYGVLGGIIVGILAALLWQKYYRIKLPDWLAFFGGRRFVPIVTSFVTMLVGVVMGFIYPAFNWLINVKLGGWLMSAGAPDASSASKAFVGFIYGVINRLLIPFGLHHLWNSIPWFQLGTCTDASGKELHGDLTCFFSGTPETSAWTGNFTSGFFPIMMFALPAAALAMAHVSKESKRAATTALMVSVGFTAFLTGVTEPLEFAFAYAAFPLYAVHAVLTGTALAVTNALGAKDSFSFSAGAIDFLLNLGKSADKSGGWFQGPIMLIILGLIFAVIYYFLFRFMIVKFDFKTPGREDDDTADAFAEAQATAAQRTGKNAK